MIFSIESIGKGKRFADKKNHFKNILFWGEGVSQALLLNNKNPLLNLVNPKWTFFVFSCYKDIGYKVTYCHNVVVMKYVTSNDAMWDKVYK